MVGRPDVRGREMILRVHTKKVPLSDDVDLSVVARGTPGFAGADLANLVNESALIAARQNRKVVAHADFELAKDKVMMGVERKSLIISDAEKRNTAYHEAGHALVAALLPNADPLHKVTIIPRGMALGVTMQLPIDDKHSYSKDYLEAQLTILMAGRIAEEKYLHHLTTGAGNDIERATELARKMVCEWGMSQLGPLSFGKKEEQIFLGREIAQHRDYSEATAMKIDEQVRGLVEDAYLRASQIIVKHSGALVRIAETLLEREVLDGAEVMALIEGVPAAAEPAGADNQGSQQVIRPEGGRRVPGLIEGERPQPA
jgi:cell division protease FtsH